MIINAGTAIILIMTLVFITQLRIDDCSEWLAHQPILAFRGDYSGHTLITESGEMYPNPAYKDEDKDACTRALHSNLNSATHGRRVSDEGTAHTMGNTLIRQTSKSMIFNNIDFTSLCLSDQVAECVDGRKYAWKNVEQYTSEFEVDNLQNVCCYITGGACSSVKECRQTPPQLPVCVDNSSLVLNTYSSHWFFICTPTQLPQTQSTPFKESTISDWGNEAHAIATSESCAGICKKSDTMTTNKMCCQIPPNKCNTQMGCDSQYLPQSCQQILPPQNVNPLFAIDSSSNLGGYVKVIFVKIDSGWKYVCYYPTSLTEMD